MRLLPFFVFVGLASGLAARGQLHNAEYALRLMPDHAIEVRTQAALVQRLAPEFVVMFSAREPGFGINRIAPFQLTLPRPFPTAPATAQRWAFYSDVPARPAAEMEALGLPEAVTLRVNSLGERFVGYRDARGNRAEMKESLALRGTVNPFHAGAKTVLKAVAASKMGDRIVWEFAPQPDFSLSAEVDLPAERGDPRIRYRLKARRTGFYSIAFTGAPWVDGERLVPVPQETLGSGRGAGAANYVMSEAHVTLPRVHLATVQQNSILVVDPAESPFRLVEDSKAVWTYALAQESNSRFGLMTEERDRRLRPVVFSPLMGGAESRLNAGETYSFALRYVLRDGPWEESFRHVAREIYRFRDLRDNSGPGPLYRTIENLMDYLGERDTANYSMWHAEQKYYNYWSDQSGIFKPFSPLFGLSAAILTDDETFYRHRALPMVEFALSRRSNMFTPYDVEPTGMVNTFDSSLGAPYIDAGQLHSLDGMFQHRTRAFSHYAKTQKAGKNILLRALANYRVTGRKEFLAGAERHAAGGRGNFMDLLELYEDTKNAKYLKSAREAAYHYAAILNLFPAVPDEVVTVETGNQVPIHGHAYQRHEDWGFAPPAPLSAPQRTVPAWRASLIGTELSAYRGGYWLHNHGQLMRLATYTGDEFLRDLQRWAMVGRFANYAGDFRSNRHSLVAELPDAPLHHIYETNYSTFNPGHGCEWLGAVIDFMVSDLFNRSNQRIDFPSRCMYESSFRVKVYGDRPGHFYDEPNTRLWLPRHLLAADNKQVDYLAAHGNGKLYVVFWNQSFQPEKVSVKFNRGLVEYAGAHRARTWVNNVEQEPVQVRDHGLQFDVGPKGIVAYAIENATLKLGLQAKLLASDARMLGEESITGSQAPFGRVTAMLLSLGKGLTTSFVYTDAPAANVISARLRYRQGDASWSEKTDAIYPYEFSTAIDEAKGRFECVLEVETANQTIEKSELLVLPL